MQPLSNNTHESLELADEFLNAAWAAIPQTKKLRRWMPFVRSTNCDGDRRVQDALQIVMGMNEKPHGCEEKDHISASIIVSWMFTLPYWGSGICWKCYSTSCISECTYTVTKIKLSGSDRHKLQPVDTWY